MIKVSIIIPVYRVEAQLERCIASVRNQSNANIEIILIDDGSPDNSGSLCDKYLEQDDRIIVVHQQNNGVSVARNNAIKCVTGDYLIFLDGDDALDLETVETCVKESENGKWNAVAFGFHHFIETDGNVKLQNDTCCEKSEVKDKKALRAKFLYYCKSGALDFVTDKMMRISIIRENGIKFNSDFNIGGEDALFIMDLFPHLSSFKVTEHVFYQYYRRSGESITLTFHPDKFRRYVERVLRLYNLMKTLNAVDEEYLIKQYGVYFLWSYESMFAENCRLSSRERLRYIKKNYRLQKIFDKQNKIIKTVLKDKENFADYCSSSLVALKLFYKRHTFLLWCWQTLTMLISRRKNGK